MSNFSLFQIILIFIAVIFLIYAIPRLFFRAIFKSYFEIKKEETKEIDKCLERRKQEKEIMQKEMGKYLEKIKKEKENEK